MKYIFSYIFKNCKGPPNPENVPEDGKLKSEIMIKENRRYYLDLKENARGRFLRVWYIIKLNIDYNLKFLFFSSAHKLLQEEDHDRK